MGRVLREAIILNISTKEGQLLEGGDQSRGGYYLRKCSRLYRRFRASATQAKKSK